MGTLLSITYFIQRQQLEEARLGKDLISDFNARYDKLNARLSKIVAASYKDAMLRAYEVATLDDYFNLCSEEYLFYKKGYIYPEVWDAWFSGIRTYFQDWRVRKAWSDDKSKESYYGFAEYISQDFFCLLEVSRKDSASYALRGQSVRYDDPFESVAEADWGKR